MFTYLLINLLSVSIPFAFSFHKRLNFYKTWYAFWPAVLITAAVFIAWDVLYTHWGIWGFNPQYLTGIYLLNLPLEEWLFFICIPYASVFTYASLNELIKKDIFAKIAAPLSWVLILGLFLIGLLNLGRLYTGVTFIASAVFLLANITVFKSKFLGRFYLAYIAVFAGPFLIVNGILTGSFIDGTVVWYNNSENLFFRVFTIPVEDFIYGFFLLLMNITLYEYFMSRKAEADAVKNG